MATSVSTVTPFKLIKSTLIFAADNESDFKVTTQEFNTAHKQKVDEDSGAVLADYPSEHKKVVRIEQDKVTWNATTRTRELRTISIDVSPDTFNDFVVSLKQ